MSQNKTEQHFYFHDYETFGISPAYDKPAQFGGICTDENFAIIGDPLVMYCKSPDDYLPDPQAILVTGITPQEACEKGICEAEFAKKIHHAFSQPMRCIVGYNNIRFDEEFTRHLLYRNFYDPYDYAWKNGNSRWDLLDMVRACYALRPSGIVWPTNEKGLPSFRLELLAKANDIEHDNAHDAMCDVYATIAIAKLLKAKQPKLFDYLFRLRNKNHVSTLIDVVHMVPLVHISGKLGAYRGNTTWVAPLAWHPEQKNAVIVCDLMGDIESLIEDSIESLQARLYTKSEDLLPHQKRVPIKLIHTNKCPVIAPAKTLSPENAERINVDRKQCLINLARLRKHQLLIQNKVTTLFSTCSLSGNKHRDVDGQLYDGFLSATDRVTCEMIRHTRPSLLSNLKPVFQDERLKTLFFRYKARNYPHTLSDDEQKRWESYRREKFNDHRVRDYLFSLEQLVTKYEQTPKKVQLLQSVYDYFQYIITS